ncbi:hypothetical protein [Ideonella alba]|uniref:Uncharacterized protein n=1 Tax=Ideonella alba TaxID=2824118 RepID=A0A940Y778_9BURK|nr:hypothetical protein [Ideonella alba]MBQ0930043.1 hypothetical protein [Ideonella alba]
MDARHSTLCLLAPGQLSRLLRWMEQLPASPHLRPMDLADAWRAAGPRWERLSREEAGRADEPVVRPLPPEVQAHVEAVIATPAVQRTFDAVPVAFGMVPLAQLMASQYSLTGATVDALSAGAPPDPAALAALCLPLQGGDADAGLRLVHRGPREMVFVSDTHDTRMLDTRCFMGAERPELPVRGHPEAMVGLFLGQSTNLVNVLLHRRRLLVNNGHHRLHALLAAGVSHVPALIQVCGSREEFDEVAPRAARDAYHPYFESPRPPLLADFADPALTLAVRTPPMRRELKVTFEWESKMVAI